MEIPSYLSSKVRQRIRSLYVLNKHTQTDLALLFRTQRAAINRVLKDPNSPPLDPRVQAWRDAGDALADELLVEATRTVKIVASVEDILRMSAL